MRYSVSEYGRLSVKALLGARSSEFGLRPVAVTADAFRLRVKPKSAPHASTITLRRGSSDFMSFAQVFIEKQYGLRPLPQWRSICAAYERCAASGTPVILDLGANIGMSALYFAGVWQSAYVLAVEPDAENFTVLQSNTSSVGNIFPVHAAVANADGAARLLDSTAEAWSKRIEVVRAGSLADVPAVCVDSLIARCPADARPFLAKVDIEGFEANLFAQNTAWVSRFPVVVVELHDWRFPGCGTAKPFFAVMAQQNRDFVILGENIVCISA